MDDGTHVFNILLILSILVFIGIIVWVSKAFYDIIKPKKKSMNS